MHVPGSKMVQSDALSRRPDHVPEEDTDNEYLILLPDELFINLVNIELAKMIESAATLDEMGFTDQIKPLRLESRRWNAILSRSMLHP